MDQKAWLWRKKPSEKTIVATDKVDVTLKQIDEQVQTFRTGRPERSVKNLNEKLASVLLDCHPNDEIVREHAKLPQESNAGQEKPEAEAALVKKELDEDLRLQLTSNGKITHSDAALMKCTRRLNFVPEEEEQRMNDAVTRTTSEFEKAQKELEKNLREANERIAKLAAENSHLSKALIVKEKLIEDLSKHKSQAEAEFNTLMSRLDATEKENAFLKYEFRILEKELEIRNEEMEYTRRSVEATHKQHLESVKKITKLEAECQRLRLLVRKRQPGSAVSTKMKSEAETLGWDQMDMRRRKLNPSRDLILREATIESCPEISGKKISLIEQLHDMEEENKTLKYIVTMKSTELQASRMMYSRTASRLSYVESQLKEICKGQKSMELARRVPISSEFSMIIDNSSDDGISSSGSWANALISELEHFKDGKIKNQLEQKASDMSLMDDFVEMEKLAIVSMEAPSIGGTSKELVPVVRSDSNLTETKQEIHSRDIATEKSFDWLQVVLNAMLRQRQISKQSLYELLEDIRIALGYVNYPTVIAADSVAISSHPQKSDSHNIGSYITLKSPNKSPAAHSLDGDCRIDKETSSQYFESNLSKSICKIIELIEGVKITSSVSYPYSVHVFQWQPSELSVVLQKFVGACNDLLNGKADLDKFVGELSYALHWIMNNCIAPKDASSARNKIKKHFGWKESPSGNKVGVAVDGLLGESNTVYVPPEEQSSCLCSAAPLPEQNISFQKQCIQGNLHEENRRLKDELKSLEARLESATDKNKALMEQLCELKEHIGSIETELKTLKKSNEIIEEQIENQKLMNEDLDAQLTVSKAKLNEIFQKYSSLEVELEYKNNCCEELEATCLELQLQLESVAKKDSPEYGINQEGKQSQNGWEITAASVKLAECQETILNLGKQLKALASPQEAVLFDKVFSTTNPGTTTINSKKLNKHFSLRDQMLAEDSTKADLVKSPDSKATLNIKDAPKPSLLHSSIEDAPNILIQTPEAHFSPKNKTNNTATGSLAIVPSKKRGVGFLMKLLLRRKKARSLAKV